MLTNLRDAFGGQSRSPNIVPFHRLGILSCCAIVTFSLRRAVFTIFHFKKCCDLDTWGQRSLKVIDSDLFDRLCMVCVCSLVTLSIKCTVFEIFDFKIAVTMKTELGVRQGHWKCHHVIEHI